LCQRKGADLLEKSTCIEGLTKSEAHPYFVRDFGA